MHPHFSPKRFCILLMILASLAGCKKAVSLITNNLPPPPPTTVDSSGTGFDTIPPAVTPVGTPVGNIITKTIGASGGSITSDDGRVQLTIPPGALSANTNISIQAVTNTCPGGIGVSYDLLPNGTKFSTPASLTFNYADSDVDGTDPLLIYTAFQDSIGQWEVVDSDKEVDTVGKTISFDINHFTIYSAAPGVYVQAYSKEVNASQTSSVEVRQWVSSKKYYPLLLPARSFKTSQVSDWAVNGAAGGSSNDGTIAGGNSGTATYTAPGNIVDNRYVNVSVAVSEPRTIRVRKGKIIQFDKHTYSTRLKLIGEIIYDVKVYLTQTGLSTVLPDVYHDAATFAVYVKNGQVTIPQAEIVNQEPTVTPSKDGDMENGPGYIWIPDHTGLINITAVSGFATTGGNGQPGLVVLTLTTTGTVDPQYTINDGFTTRSIGGDPSEGWPGQYLSITLKDEIQGQDPKPGWGYSMTPRH